MTGERRLHRRQAVFSAPYVELDSGNGGLVFDLGEGGMGISVAQSLTPQQHSRFSFSLSLNSRLRGFGEVVWVAESGKSAGIRFLEVPVESSRHLRDWLALAAPPGAAPELGFPPGPPEDAPVESEGEPAAPEERSASFAENSSSPPRETEPPTEPAHINLAPAFSENYQPASATSFAVEEGDQEDRSEALPILRIPVSHSHEEEKEEARKKHRRNMLLAGLCAGAALAVGIAALAVFRARHEDISVAFGDFKKKLTSFVWHSDVERMPIPAPSPKKSKPSSRRTGAPRSQPVEARQRSSTAATPASADPNLKRTEKDGALNPFEVVVLGKRRWVIPSRTTTIIGFQDSGVNSAGGEEDGKSNSAPPLQSALNSQGSGQPPVAQEAVAGPPGQPIHLALELQGREAAPEPVVLQAVIDKDGTVRQVELIGPPSPLASAVMQAVKRWRYRPFYRNGKPAEAVVRITIDVKLANHTPE